jgi:hypothetical protein
MAYRKRKNSWIVDVTVNGKRRYQTFKTEDEAKLGEVHLELAMKREQEAASKVDAPGAGATIAPVVGHWTLAEAIKVALKTRWSGTKSEDFYTRHTRYLTDYFKADMPLEKITTEVVDAYPG